MTEITPDMVCKGSSSGPNGEFCASRWVRRLYKDLDPSRIAMQQLCKIVLGYETDSHWGSVVGWNDDPDTTKQQIADALNELQRRMEARDDPRGTNQQTRIAARRGEAGESGAAAEAA